MYTHQPFSVALCAIQIEELNGDGLGREAGPELVINEALVDRAEAAFAEEITRREVLRDHLQLLKRENMEIGARERDG